MSTTVGPNVHRPAAESAPAVPSPPPLLLAAGVCLWGGMSGLILLAVPLAVILELPWRVRGRLELTHREFNRLVDLSSVVLAFLAVYFYLVEGVHGLLMVVTWMPVALFPLVAVQRFSRPGCTPISSLFLSLRRAANQGHGFPCVDLSYPFLVLALIAASIHEHPLFFPAVVGLIGWGLWFQRPRRVPVALWGVLFITGAGLGFAAQLGMHRTQLALEERIMDWLSGRWGERDPFERDTAIGEIRALKGSESIRFRLEGIEPDADRPMLLREATYDSYRAAHWYASDTAFDPLMPDEETGVRLAPGRDGESIRLIRFLSRDAALVPLPVSVAAIEDVRVGDLQANDLGTVKAEQLSGALRLSFERGASTPLDAPPKARDQRYPTREQPGLAPILADLPGASEVGPQAAVEAVRAYFRTGYAYTLNPQAEAGAGLTAVGDFLLNERAGHCEYYATATVLLLRGLGVPARYASGYAAVEYSPLEEAVIVRQRHAHAWAQAYVAGRWINVDTTPSEWVATEAAQRPMWGGLSDRWAWLVHQIRLSRLEDDSRPTDHLIWLLIPLGALLLWRILRRGRVQSGRRAPEGSAGQPGRPLDSPLYPILDTLAERGYHRPPGEPLAVWVERSRPPYPGVLAELIVHHGRLRYDPATTTETEAWQRLEALAREWWQRFEASRAERPGS